MWDFILKYGSTIDRYPALISKLNDNSTEVSEHIKTPEITVAWKNLEGSEDTKNPTPDSLIVDSPDSDEMPAASDDRSVDSSVDSSSMDPSVDPSVDPSIDPYLIYQNLIGLPPGAIIWMINQILMRCPQYQTIIQSKITKYIENLGLK